MITILLLTLSHIFMTFAWPLSKRAMVRKELSAREATLIDRDLLTLPLSLRASVAVADAGSSGGAEIQSFGL